MSTINAASTAKVRYVASLALRAGQVPSVTSVVMPTISASTATQLVGATTHLIQGGVHAHPNAAPAPHQLKLVAAMASVSGVVPPQPTSRWHADQVAIAWFKRNTVAGANLPSAHAQTNMVSLLEQLAVSAASAAA